LEANFEIEKFISGLCSYISEVDRKRPYQRGVIPRLYFASNERNYFVKHNPGLYKKTRVDLDPFFKRVTKLDYVDNIIIITICVLFLLVTIVGVALYFKYKSILFIIAIIIVDMFCFFALFFISINRRMRIAGEMYDEDIKKVVQELLDYGRELIREKGLNPEYFPLKLKHDDYEGVIYESDENNYKGYLVIK